MAIKRVESALGASRITVEASSAAKCLRLRNRGCERAKSPCGLTLIEVMCAILVLSVAVLGASAYRYYATLDVRKAEQQVTAARLALLLCEGWRGVKATETYDPVGYFGQELDIEAVDEGPKIPAESGYLGHYKIDVGSVDYHSMLGWNGDANGLRALNVYVAFQDSGSGSEVTKSYKLSTYASD